MTVPLIVPVLIVVCANVNSDELTNSKKNARSGREIRGEKSDLGILSSAKDSLDTRTLGGRAPAFERRGLETTTSQREICGPNDQRWQNPVQRTEQFARQPRSRGKTNK